MMQAVDGMMIMTDYDPVQEEEASILGGALLVPRESLLNHINNGMSDDDAATYFGVSVPLIRQRKNITGIGFQLARRGTWRP
jgi:Zn-dependent peptidase ImmA (M78 family)